jgi:hypothetical protein
VALTIFGITGVSPNRRERIEAAVEAGGKRTSNQCEAWILADSFGKMVRVLMTGPQGFEHTVTFAVDEDPVSIEQMVRETIEE